MNYGKKIAALLLAVALVLSLAVTASAKTTTGSITINPAVSGKTYNIYRIFDMTMASAPSAVSYTIAAKWSGFFEAGAAGASYITETQGSLTNQIVVDGAKKWINITASNVAAFAKAAFDYAIKNSIENDGTVTAEDTTATISNLPLGYYMVYPQGASQLLDNQTSVCNLTSTAPHATISPKATYPTIDKVVDDADVEIGQVVTYTITGKVPDTTGYTTYTYKITDTMSGLKLNGVYSVSINGTVIANNSASGSGENNVTGTRPTAEATSFEINIDVMKYQEQVGKEIKITYQAVVSEDAVTSPTGNTNDAELTYSNNPSESDSTDTSTDEETVYTVDLEITKVDADKTDTKLSGAKFVLYKGSKGSPTHYYKWNGTDKKVEWVQLGVSGVPSDLESAISGGYVTEVTTAETTGLATFEGLAAGTYYLHETQAPDGYNKLTEDVEVTITRGENEGAVTITGNEVTVQNSSGSQLPGTGGIGTTIFYVVGGVIMAGAVILLLLKKKHAEN